ncbi:MAG: DUF262 domain-containing protein [Lentisphaeria bacterium]|nr:DUF262 domain-containing protein [Lentisphaeria bacterium]
MSIENWSIQKLLQESSSIGVPHFQRGYVWNEANISALLESLYFDTPCGNIVLWKIPKMDKSKSEDYGVPLTAQNDKNNIEQFIIDGQQRTRSLLSVFCPDKASTEAAGNDTENNNSEDKNDSEQSDENATDAQKHIPYVWAVNLARFAETVLDDKYKGLLDFPSHNPAGLFVKIRDPQKQKEAYIEYVQKKIKNVKAPKEDATESHDATNTKGNEKTKKQTITFFPEYRCQYNFIPLSFFFNLGDPANVTAKEEMQYTVVPYSSLSRSPEDYIVKNDEESKNEPEEKKRLFDKLPNNAVFIKYKGSPQEEQEKFKSLLDDLKSKLAEMLERQLAVRVLNTTDLSDVIHTFIRINSGGKAVQEEEKTLARLVQLSPEKTDDKEKKGAFSVLKDLFKEIHPGEATGINEHLQRLKENRFGFRLFIRVFVLAANYHTGKAMGTQAMSFSAIQNNERLESEEGQKKIPAIWDCVKSVTMAVYNLLTENLHFDTLAFLPDSRSLRPVFMLLIKYPKFMEDNKIKDAYKPHMAYILLSLLLGAGDSEIDIMNFVTQIRNSPLDGCSLLKLLTTAPREKITVDKICTIANLTIPNLKDEEYLKQFKTAFWEDCNALMTIWEKIRNAGNEGSLEDNLKKKFPSVNALTNRYILLLYVLEKHLGAVDFNGESLKNIKDENGNILDFSRFYVERDIQANMKSVCGQSENPPEKQHIVPYYWLHPENEGRKSNDYANNIGNITYISHELNHYETGLGKYWLNLEAADAILLRGHIISEDAKKLYNSMTPNTTISMAKNSNFDNWVTQRQADIAKAFCTWVEELRSKAWNTELTEQTPHARRLIPPCAEKKKKAEESKTVFKYLWADIMTEVWQWKDLGFENQKLLAALHEQVQCYIKLTQDGDHEYYELFMRQQGKKMASKVESEKANQQEAKDIISEALKRFRYNKKEKEQ